MNIHLITIAKNEELYIEDWILYHFLKGFDKICIYDNNDNMETLPNLLKNSIKLNSFKDKILIKHWNGLQTDAYIDYWKSNDFDWVSILDVDEFIDFNGFCSNIHELVESRKDDELISLKCIEYGDNEIIERFPIKEKSKNVVEIFTKRSEYVLERSYKSIYNKSKLTITPKTHLTHFYRDRTLRIVYLRPFNKEEHKVNFKKLPLNNEPFVRHIRTYSLQEFLNQKYKVINQRISKLNDIRRCLLSQYYFKINKWTPEKQKYIEQFRKDNGMIRILFMCSENIFNSHSFLKKHFCYVFGNPLNKFGKIKNDLKFSGISELISIIYEFDLIIFL